MFSIETFVENFRSDQGGVYVTNSGEIGDSHWDPGLLRPYRDDKGKVWVDVTRGFSQKKDKDGRAIYNNFGAPVIERVTQSQLVSDRVRHGLPVLNVNNATALSKDQWIMFDSTVREAARPRMRLWGDLRAAVTFGGFDGMATPILEDEIVTDPGEALMDIEGLSEGRNFAPRYQIQGVPLPITHCDFWISERFLASSRKRGVPQSTVRARFASQRVAELIEKTAIGASATPLQYGASSEYRNTSKVYGLLNHPDRINITSFPVASAALNIDTGEEFYNGVLAVREEAYRNGFYGPFALYVSSAYDAKLDQHFVVGTGTAGLAAPSGTIRQAVLEIDGIDSIRRLDYLGGDVMVLVQMDPDVIQAVNGLELTVVQWDTKGGMQHNFKVMAIQVPWIHSRHITGTGEPVQTGDVKTGIFKITTS